MRLREVTLLSKNGTLLVTLTLLAEYGGALLLLVTTLLLRLLLS